ncbi:hypothetical protein DFH09DRAFT_1366183 [Mycena vulgaris]|nr:hypothetical protein DFH09DRAFT_1366183 [Mycena vulgaris]
MTSSLDIVPKSSSYPNLIAIRRKLRGLPKLLPGKSLPYENKVDDELVFYEFRGIGTPPGDIGRPGDIYWDSSFPYILYFWGAQGWQPWNPQADVGSQPLARHPNFDNRYLWFHGHGLSWLTNRALTVSDSCVDPKKAHAMDMQVLVDILHSSPSTPSLRLHLGDNQKRHDAEAHRRNLNGITVCEAPTPRARLVQLRRKTKKVEVSSGSQPNIEPVEDLPSSVVAILREGIKQRSELAARERMLSAQVDTLKEERSLRLALVEREKSLSEEVQTLKSDNVSLQLLLEEAGRLRNAADFSHLIESENAFRALKRKHEEDLYQRDDQFGARHLQACARIKELEEAHDDLEKAHNEDVEIAAITGASEGPRGSGKQGLFVGK